MSQLIINRWDEKWRAFFSLVLYGFFTYVLVFEILYLNSVHLIHNGFLTDVDLILFPSYFALFYSLREVFINLEVFFKRMKGFKRLEIPKIITWLIISLIVLTPFYFINGWENFKLHYYYIYKIIFLFFLLYELIRTLLYKEEDY